ncbi:MAG: amino acid racemase, partial [Myxococcota bacterium]
NGYCGGCDHVVIDAMHSIGAQHQGFRSRPFEASRDVGDWDQAGRVLADIAARLEGAGAEALVLCTNTMHRVYDDMVAATTVPILHIADGTGDAMAQRGVETVGLLGTKFTMEQDFYRRRLEQRGFHVVIPEAAAREDVHRIIYDELCLGVVKEASRDRYREVVRELQLAGAEGIILGCTEIGLLLDSQSTDAPLFDTTLLHVEAALDWSLRSER